MADGRKPHEKCGALWLGLDGHGAGHKCLECDKGLDKEDAENWNKNDREDWEMGEKISYRPLKRTKFYYSICLRRE